MNRIEYKYYVNDSFVPMLMRDLSYICQKDKNSSHTKGYDVISEYYDDLFLTNYLEKQSGNSVRKKIRKRRYGLDSSHRPFFEIERKIVDRISKEKPSSNVNKHSDKTRSHRNGGIDPTEVLIKFLNLSPVVEIKYQRLAYFLRADKAVRITIDSQLWCRKLTRNGNSRFGWIRLMNVGYSILEIKSPGYMPLQVLSVVQKYQLQRRAISKYTLATKQIGCNYSMVGN